MPSSAVFSKHKIFPPHEKDSGYAENMDFQCCPSETPSRYLDNAFPWILSALKPGGDLLKSEKKGPLSHTLPYSATQVTNPFVPPWFSIMYKITFLTSCLQFLTLSGWEWGTQALENNRVTLSKFPSLPEPQHPAKNSYYNNSYNIGHCHDNWYYNNKYIVYRVVVMMKCMQNAHFRHDISVCGY
jgi:hypothetical protein